MAKHPMACNPPHQIESEINFRLPVTRTRRFSECSESQDTHPLSSHIQTESENETLLPVGIQQNPEGVSIYRKKKSRPKRRKNQVTHPLSSRSVSEEYYIVDGGYSWSSSSENEDTYFPQTMMARINEAVIAGGEEHKLETLQIRRKRYFRQLKVAEIAVRLGLQPQLQLVLNQFPFLLDERNARGDGLLHVAARAGQLNILNYLLDPNSRNLDTRILTRRNVKGNTALHEAVENKHEEIALILFKKHPKLLYLPNKAGETPPFLAAEAGLQQLLRDMLVLLPDSQDLSKWGGKKTPLHGAVIRKHPDTEILKLVLDRMPQLIDVPDSMERTPLHYAACIGYSDGLIKLLDKGTHPAYQADHYGFYPIHIAASNGHIEVIQLLFKNCPRSWSLLSKKGWNILHVASLNDKENVVRYILKEPEMAMLINDVDEDGNTPLHLATKERNFKVVRALTMDRRVNMSIINGNNLTALDIAEENMVNATSFRRMLTLTALRIANAPRARKLDSFFNGEPRTSNGGQQPTTVKSYNDRVNTLLLVSTLVTTVTFTAGFTVPGGLNSSGGADQGIATMLNHTMFKVFVLSNTIALFCSILAVISLIWAQVGDIPLVRSIVSFTWALLGISLSMMTVAFTAGLYIVTHQLRWLASAILILTIIFLICALTLLLPLRMPIWSKHRFFQSISYHFIHRLVALTRGGSDRDYNGDIEEQRNLIAASDIRDKDYYEA